MWRAEESLASRRVCGVSVWMREAASRVEWELGLAVR